MEAARATEHGRAAGPGEPAGRAHRLGLLLEVVRGSGRRTTSTGELAATLGVSAATVRRDLAVLEDQRLLRRVHGGAAPLDDAPLPVRYRGGEQRAAKLAIAEEAARRIPRGAHALGLTGGSTTGEVARALTDRRGLTVITNAIDVALDLVLRPHVKVVMTGGVARSQSYELVGPWAEQTLQAVNLGTAVVGVDGISTEGLTTHDEVEAGVDAAMLRRAQRVLVVADGTKLGRVHLARICPLADVDELITDAGAPPEEVAALRRAGLAVTVVEP
ncbi:DeoR/GlpR family DNA-binding transcription regulator [Pseudokineococcus basanitobsidens]|uniref:DeoR/GlpR family DNA-binding transcription regulator n=1 Tax=Pseudokineococcus basanitobsidens TaxID=1926649 RepID=A0ABU8RNM1_9ACTN